MYNVLHVLGGACYGGISAVVLNYYSNIDRTKIHFDIAVTDKYIGRHANILESMGCRVFPICLKSENLKLYKSQVKEIFGKGNYDAVHVHSNDTSWITLRIAKQMGIKTRIAHAHTAGHLGSDTIKFKIRQTVCQFLNRHFATNLLSCGKKAGEFIYGETGTKMRKHTILPNAIDTERFSFNPDKRRQMRRCLNLDNSFIVGMIGRLAPPKNTIYAISIFKAIKDKIPNAKLLMAGSGPDEEATKADACRLGLEQDVLFLGQRSDVYYLYQALDLYILPSLYEGFPVAAVEAMSTGLPCLLSDTITDELKFGAKVHYLPLNNVSLWGDIAKQYVVDQDRYSGQTEIKMNGLDIKDTAKQLEHIYLGFK